MAAKEAIKRKRIGAFAKITYAAYVRQLKRICKQKKFELRELGAVGTKKIMPLYALTLNPKARAKTICISAGVHGSEESGPLAVLKFLQQIKPATFRTTKVIIFPCANPTGFDVRRRENHQGYDLNRRFMGHWLPEENQLMLAELQKEIVARRLKLFLALHEHDGHAVFFHVYNKSRLTAYRNLLEGQGRYFPLIEERKRYHYTLHQGMSFDYRDKSFDDRLNRNGVPYCITAEIPTLYPISHMIKAQITLMNDAIQFVAKL